jgi:UTP--glucose-1-phosphate uridylyltransferase
MKKEQAIDLFGGPGRATATNLAGALGVTRQAISQWPAKLDQRTTDEIIGAAVRLGIIKNYQDYKRLEL